MLDAAGLPWTARAAGAGAIARVEFDTARLEALVPLEPARPGALVADWRADRAAEAAGTTVGGPVG